MNEIDKSGRRVVSRVIQVAAFFKDSETLPATSPSYAGIGDGTCKGSWPTHFARSNPVSVRLPFADSGCCGSYTDWRGLCVVVGMWTNGARNLKAWVIKSMRDVGLHANAWNQC